jgi:glutathione S-transferase
MKLYYVPRTRAGRVRWMLEEMGLPYELSRLDIAARQNKTPEYLSIHPLGKVPALVDGEVTIFESAAIIAWLADRFPEKRMAPPPSSPQRAAYHQWMFYAVTTLEPPIAAIAHAQQDKSDAATLAEAREKLREYLVPVEKALVGRSFVLGEEFSAADVVLGGVLGWARVLGMLEDRPLLQGYVARLIERPAFRRSRAD